MTPPRPPVLPSVTAAQERYHADLVDEVAKAVAAHEVVVVGVSGLPPGRKARRLLEAENIPYRYLQYGSYLRGWKRRLALKIWMGWPTFPMIFVRGTFIGGASDLRRLSQAGELKKMLAHSGG